MLAVALELQHRALFVRQFPQGILHSAVVNLEQYDIVYLLVEPPTHETGSQCVVAFVSFYGVPNT